MYFQNNRYMKSLSKVFIVLFVLLMHNAKAQYGIGLQLGAQIQTGEDAKNLSIAPAAEFNFSYRMDSNAVFKIGVGSYQFNVKNLPDGVSLNYANVPVTAAVQYSFDIHKFRPFAEVGFGLLFSKTTA
jgi:hypothetical protein